MRRSLGCLLLAAAALLAVAPARGQVATVGQGATPAKYLSAASTNATLVSAGQHTLYALSIVNTTTTLYYLKLYDKATAPTCGTDTPIQTIPIPFGAANAGGGFVADYSVGLSFISGLGFCLVGGIADNDSTNAATGLAINIGYK